MKTKRLLLSLVALLTMTHAMADVEIKESNFPDANFRSYLRSQEYGNDGVITDEEIAGITSINVHSKSIAKLKGIEFFTALTTLRCSNNNLITLDVSKNTALTELYCQNNQLIALDVSGCTALTTLYCSNNNKLNSLDVSKNTALTSLLCSYNQLTTLDVSKNTALITLQCNNNQLTALDVSKNAALTSLYCFSNQIKNAEMDALIESLPVVSGGNFRVIYNESEGNVITTTQVDAAKAKGWAPMYYDGSNWIEYTDSEPTTEGIAITEENFPDANFRTWLLGQSYGSDGVITNAEIATITEISVNLQSIASLKGIEFFTALTTLYCIKNQLTALDLSKNTALKTLACYDNQLTALDLSKNTALTGLFCQTNQLTSLNVSGCTALTQLSCQQNKIKGAAMDAFIASLPTVNYASLLVIYNTNEGNVITTAQVTAAKAKGWIPYYYTGQWQEYAGSEPAVDLEINETNFPDENFRNYLLEQSYGSDGVITDEEIATITDINVNSKNIASLKGIEFFTALTKLYCYNNKLTSLDVSKNTALTSLNCGDNPLTTLDVSKNTALTSLLCYDNQLTALDVSQNMALTRLDCRSNQLTVLDVSKNTALTSLYCPNNQLTALDVSKNTALKRLDCYLNQIKGTAMDALVESLPTTSGADLYVIVDTNEGNVMTTTQVAVAKAKGWTPYIGEYWGSYEGIDYYDFKEYAGSAPTAIEINETNFPDANFRTWLLEQSYGQDGVITDAEIATITDIKVFAKNITSLKGIEFFTALTGLGCGDNPLTTLDVSKNTALTKLRCEYNQLTSLDVSKNTALEWLYCYNNQLTALDVSGCTALTTLYCYNNQLTTLDLSKNTALITLYCDNNQLTALDVSKNTALEWLHCDNNQLTALDVSKNTALTELRCEHNQLTALDLSKNTALTELFCFDNQLTQLNLSQIPLIRLIHCAGNLIKGEAMDIFVASLPTATEATLHMLYPSSSHEGNVMTTTQVAAAKAKGWTPSYYDGKHWQEYAGSEPTAIEGISSDETSDSNAVYFDLNGRRLTDKPTQKGIYVRDGKKVVVK